MSDAQPQAPVDARVMLDAQLEKMTNAYARAVRNVNLMLLERNVPLSHPARQGMVHNATRVELGQASPETASLSEVPILLGEAVQCLKAKKVASAGLFTLGAITNATAAPLLGIAAMHFNALPVPNKIFQMDGDAMFPGAGADNLDFP